MLKGYEVSYLINKISPFIHLSVIKLDPEKVIPNQIESIAAEYVDLPLNLLGHSNNPIKPKNTNIIASWHDYSGTPRMEELERIAREAFRFGIPKIVTKATDLEDNLKVLKLYRIFSKPIIAFCMGGKGIVSRFLSVKLGSPILYSCLKGEEVAEGQPDLKTALEIRDMLE